MPRNVPHQFRNVGATTGTVIFTITPAGLEKMFLTMSQRGLIASAYMGPLNHELVAIGGGVASRNPFDMMEYIRRSPHGSVMFMESWMRTVYPLGMAAVALGQHVRVGIEDTIWGPKKGQRMGTVDQV